MSYVPPNPIPLWPAFFPSAPVVPKLYYDALSPEQRIKKLCEELHRLCEYANLLGVNINLDHEAIAQLQADFQRFIDGEFNDYYKQVIYQWIQDHFAELISNGIRQVYFGLTDDGYFCAYVPASWAEITFDTGAVFGRSDYGRLMLRFEADPNAHSIDNTYNTNAYSLNNVGRQLKALIDQLIVDVEVNSNRTDDAYNTLFTNLDEVVSDGNF